jgi:SNF family Na+-dependent transporter
MLIYVHFRDAMIITTLDMISSLIAGMTIFCILGNLSYQNNVDDIDEIVQGGPGLAFVAYSKGIAEIFNVPQVSDILCIRVR